MVKGSKADYDSAQRQTGDPGAGWVMFGTWGQILLGTGEGGWPEWNEYQEQQGGLGKETGNSCGFVAAARCARLLECSAAPQENYPKNDLWTDPEQLDVFINRNCKGLRSQHRTFNHGNGELPLYLAEIWRAVKEGHPCIVLLCLGSLTAFHYVVVVGYRADKEELLFLDWNGVFRIAKDKFVALSYNPIPLMDAYRIFEVRRE